MEYITDFHLLSADCSWNEDALMDVFSFGLRESIKDELSTRDYPRTLKQLEDLANRIDLRLTERRRERRALTTAFPQPALHSAPYAPASAPGPARMPEPEPMQRDAQASPRRRGHVESAVVFVSTVAVMDTSSVPVLLGVKPGWDAPDSLPPQLSCYLRLVWFLSEPQILR